MIRALGLAMCASVALAACEAAPSASPAMHACLAAARKEAAQSLPYPGAATPAQQEMAAQATCGCVQRVLTPADFEWMRPIFMIAAMEGSHDLRRYRMEAHLDALAAQNPGVSMRAQLDEKLESLGDLLSGECPEPHVQGRAPPAPSILVAPAQPEPSAEPAPPAAALTEPQPAAPAP